MYLVAQSDFGKVPNTQFFVQVTFSTITWLIFSSTFCGHSFVYQALLVDWPLLLILCICHPPLGHLQGSYPTPNNSWSVQNLEVIVWAAGQDIVLVSLWMAKKWQHCQI